jgi:hypothetical protein
MQDGKSIPVSNLLKPCNLPEHKSHCLAPIERHTTSALHNQTDSQLYPSYKTTKSEPQRQN